MTKEQFLFQISNWDNHRPLLWLALQETEGDVLELGCGQGSTPFLKKYCEKNKRNFFSYDSGLDWANQFGSIYCRDWNNFDWSHKYDVAFIDHAPGEHRKLALKLLKNKAKIIVIHDSEPKGHNSSDYQVRELFDQFKYVIDLKSKKPGAWASMLSNIIDLDKFKNQKIGGFTLV